MHRFRRSATPLAAGLAALTLAAFSWADPAVPEDPLEKWLPGFSVARCMFPQGKLVLEHEGKLLVLRPGDRLPGRPEVRVYAIDEGQAVLLESAAADGLPAAVPQRILKLVPDPEGAVAVTVLSAQLPRADETELFAEGSSIAVEADAKAAPFTVRDEAERR